MSSAVSAARETPTAWDAPAISTVRLAPARSAMMRCAPAGMLWSLLPKMNQLAVVFQSGLSPGGLVERRLGDRTLRDRHQHRLAFGHVGAELLVELLGAM